MKLIPLPSVMINEEMKDKMIVAKKIIFLFLFLLIVCQGCKEPKVRPGSSFNGSVKWALEQAQPDINSFASDVEIYSILGAMIWKDGRLPANTGSWSFVCWSSSLMKTLQVTVNYQGNIRRSVRDSEDPPSTGSGNFLPSGWVNSTDIFTSIPAPEVTKEYAQLVVFNTTSYPQEPNTAVWAINFAGGNNPLVRWDGHYIGTQSD